MMTVITLLKVFFPSLAGADEKAPSPDKRPLPLKGNSLKSCSFPHIFNLHHAFASHFCNYIVCIFPQVEDLEDSLILKKSPAASQWFLGSSESTILINFRTEPFFAYIGNFSLSIEVKYNTVTSILQSPCPLSLRPTIWIIDQLMMGTSKRSFFFNLDVYVTILHAKSHPITPCLSSHH